MSVESPLSDADLLKEVRAGDAAAYGRLYERHVAAARALARQLVRGESEVEDVMAESFTKILDLVGRGGGPESGFRTYLLTVVRRTVYDRHRVESRQVTTGEIEQYDPGVPFVDPALVGLERSMISRAFLSLPERWRAVLWHTEVEKCKPAEVASLLGLSANGVAALAYRAREGLRQAYLQMHLRAAPAHECRPVIGKMGAYVRGGLARRDSRTVDEHVNDCEECHGVLLELADVNRGLRVIVGPLVAGPVFAGYAAALAKAGSAAGGAGWLSRLSGRLRRTPSRQQVLTAGGVAVASAAVAAFVLVSGEEPATRPPAAAAPLAQPAASVQPVPMPVPSEPPARVPPPRREPPGRPRLRATIDALGALVRAQPGIVGLRLRNDGDGPSGELAATVELPPGVTLLPPARRGHGVALLAPVGTVDGWSCRQAGLGARCVRQPLAAGQGTAVFLRVLVSEQAPEGAGPAVLVDGGGPRVRARAEQGVRTVGASARFATEGRVAVRAVGNTLLSCSEEHDGCAEARRRQGDRRDNDLWPMTALDQDSSPATTASSAARLTLPKDSRVVWAGLYWSASGTEAGPIKVRAPGRRTYVSVRPDHVTTLAMPLGPAYQAFADVTALAGQARPNGFWWAADAPMAEGASNHAGWSLVMIVTGPRQPYSQAVVLDTATVVGGPTRMIHLPLGGLSPVAAPARAELVTWEGDADLGGDKVSLGTGAIRPGSGDRDRDNVFDGSANGAAGMTFGVDVDTVAAELGRRDPGLTIAADRDVVLFGVAALSVRARS
ncbi:hypothetical protein DMB42_40055 [Nonomuraea sp. WAC 01424]|nr:hypothetical protein DMB42_40055 [Nonomuraea sp. WAC 01424]